MDIRFLVRFVLTTFLLAVSPVVAAAQPCNTADKQSAANSSLPWKFRRENSTPNWETALKPVIQEMQRLFPQPPMGLELTYIVNGLEAATGNYPNFVQSYSGYFMIKDIVCENHSGVAKLLPEGETGNWMYFSANDFDRVLNNNAGYTQFRFQNTDMPLYVAGNIEIRENANGIKALYFFNKDDEQGLAGWYFSNSKILPYRRISKYEFAQSYRQYWLKKLNENIQNLERSLASSQQSINDVTNLKSSMTEKEKQQVIDSIRKGDQIAKDNIEIYRTQIQDCLRRTDAMMNASDARSDAVVNIANDLKYEPETLDAKGGKAKFVYIENRDIFNDGLSKWHPRFVVVSFRRPDASAAKTAFNKRVEDEFDFNVVRKIVGMPPMQRSATISGMGNTPGGYTSGKIENSTTTERDVAMFSENFSNQAIGQPPAKWTLSNATAVVRNDTGQPGNWLRMKETGLFFPDYAVLLLPTSFTFEFDLSWNKKISYYSPEFVFHIGAARYDNTLKRYDRGQANVNSYTSAAMERIALWIDPYWNDYGRFGIEVFDSRGGYLSRKAEKTPIFYKEKNLVHVKLVRKGSLLTIYFNDQKMMEEPVMDENVRWNFFGFTLNGGANADPADEFYLSNIRLTK